MECKFLTNGISISYDQIVKPCCVWNTDQSWRSTQHVSTVDLTQWRQIPILVEQQKLIANNQWPGYCRSCKNVEEQNRLDSIRLGGNRAYHHYSDSDITLEIRPGSVCNFACQTCWPDASSRVAQYHHQSKIIDIKDIDSNAIEDFDFLLPIADKIKDVILLGGEPFYDKNCKKFLDWAKKHLQANITMFTNGSCLDVDFLTEYQKNIKLVFSLDAIGTAAEYIRFGTVWADVVKNFNLAKTLPNVQARVNITCSVYNYWHLSDLIEMLCLDWPEVVTFGVAEEQHFSEVTVPYQLRPQLISQLETAVDMIWSSNIEQGQQHNAANAIGSIINNLKKQNWDQDQYHKLCDFIKRMDQVKRTDASSSSEFLKNMLLANQQSY
jgi:sulfatase maturation enzyme AslB (radical SAM superfamily)